jgi:hypothetical protein
MSFTIAKVKNDSLNGLPETYQTFIVKRDGEVFAELKYDRGRWKSAGGPAWKGQLITDKPFKNYVFHAKQKSKVLEWFKTDAARLIDDVH